jgi:hypothetical protein
MAAALRDVEAATLALDGSPPITRTTFPTCSYGIPDVWRGIDKDDPPIFESQAAYLKRHGLFLAGEERRADFEPGTL